MAHEPRSRLTFDQMFKKILLATAERSPCHRLQVGCVLVKDKRIISQGYNGFLPGAAHKSVVRNNHEQATVHAEQNAIVFAGPQAAGCTLYVTPLPPCARCAVIIIQAKIRRVVCPFPDFSREPWSTQSRIAEEMFDEAKWSFGDLIFTDWMTS